MPIRLTSADASVSSSVGDPFLAVELDYRASAVPTAEPLLLAVHESIEPWPTEKAAITAGAGHAPGPSPATDESDDEIWVSERPDTLRPEAAIAAEDDFVSEAPLAAAVVAVAARVTPAIRVQRWIASVVPAVALSAVGIVLSLGIVAINWSPELAEAPALANAAAVSHSSDPTALETAVSVTRAGGPVPSPVTPAQNSATVARPVAATSRANVGGPRVGTASDGQLRVTSVPSGARVTVNGIGWGQTPLTIDHLPPGMKSVRVTMDGYVSQEHVVDVRDNRPAVRLQVTLTRGADD